MRRIIASAAEGQQLAGEARDCTVRALANASGMEYLQAHALLAKHGRKSRRGAFMVTLHGAYIEAGFRLVQIFGTTVRAKVAGRQTGMTPAAGVTLGRLLPRLHTGRFIVMITGHALAVVDGQIVDRGGTLANSRVWGLYRLP